MVAILAGVASLFSFLCCCGASHIMSALCCFCCQLCMPSTASPRLTYIMLTVITLILCALSLQADVHLVSKAPEIDFQYSSETDSNSSLCKWLKRGLIFLGASSAGHVTLTLRMGTTATLFHLLMALGLIGVRSPSDPRYWLHQGCWIVKAVMYLTLWAAVGSMLCSESENLNTLVWLVTIGSLVFLVMQQVLLLGAVYSLSKVWIHNSQFLQLLAFTVSGYVGAVYLVWRISGATSWLWSFLLLALSGGLGSALAVSPFVQDKVPNSGLFQAAFVTLYCVLSADLALTESLSWVEQVLVALILGLTFWCASGPTEASDAEGVRPTSFQGKVWLERTETTEDWETLPYSCATFHCLMGLITLYGTFSVLAWGSVTYSLADTPVPNLVAQLAASYSSVHLFASVTCFLLYLWTMMAPLILVDREFY